MRNADYFRGKKVTVVGLARSGLACANLLYELGAQVSVSELKDTPATRESASNLKSPCIKLELGKHSREYIAGKDLIVVSPGVGNSSLPVVWAQESGVPVVSEIEIGWMLCPASIIALTGSSGKTTVTTLIAKVLEAAGKKAFVLGNIGNPFCREVAKISPADFVSLEVSSFQLERIRDFKPGIAVILNILRNHLDRHKDMQEYLEVKKRIFMNQDKNDYLVVNREDETLLELAKDARPRVEYFFQSPSRNPNYAAVAKVAQILGIEKEVCAKVFAGFKGLPHRMEFVAAIDNVKFINDSKATLVESTVWAINNIDSPILLIAGGKDKGVDYKGLLPAAKGRVREVILIGQAKDKIREAFSGKLPLSEAEDLRQAVEMAYKKASSGDCVLLSPMCSSFDMFSDYEERGEVFKQAVLSLARGK